MVGCVVHGCSHKTRDAAVTLHSFPKDKDVIRRWLLATGQQYDNFDKEVDKIFGSKSNSYRMCSRHFSPDCYMTNIVTGKKRLIPIAVPSVFPQILADAERTEDVTTFSDKLQSRRNSVMPSCAVCPCTTSWKKHDPSIIFHFFPKEPERLKLWLKQADLNDTDIETMVEKLSVEEACEVYRMCSLHFTRDSYIHVGCRRILKMDAIPTIFKRKRPSAVSSVSTNIPLVSGPSSSSSEKLVVFVKQNTSASSVLTNSSLPLDTQLRPETTSLSMKTPSYTTSSSPIISLSPASTPAISTSGIHKSSYKTMTTPPSSIALTIVNEAKPYSRIVLPVSGNVSSVRQMLPTTSSSAQKPPHMSVVRKTQTYQTIIPDSLPPSKKRKLEEFVSPSHFMSQISVNTGKRYLLSNSTPLVQPSRLIQKPLMVDKGVNTDFLTNRKCCCVATAHTQDKVFSGVSPEDNEFGDCSPSRSDSGNDSRVEALNLDLVKIEILPDASVHTASDIKQEYHIKVENDSSAGQPVLPPSALKCIFKVAETVKIEPNVKTEDNEFQISTSQDISDFVSHNPKNERASHIPCEPFAPIYRNPTSMETSAIQTHDEPENSVFSFHINELSEDEDESFLVPSDAEDEDDVKQVFQDLDSPVENLVEEEKYIVFESCLKRLIMMIPCRANANCMSPLTQYRKETAGSYLSVEVRCSSGHTSLLWESQPRHGYEPLGNVLLSAAVLFSGSSFVKSQQMFKLLNLKSIDKTTYSRNQSMYLFPTINHHWKEEQKAVMQSVQERPLCLAGDQQLDNPGFSANYSTYSFMDVASKKICSFSVEPVTPQVTLEGLEKIGFQKAMGELQAMNAYVKMIVTDRSIAIQEILKDSYPGIVHQLDLWHLSRSIGNEVLMAAKHKDCQILYEWVEAIRNHLWWSCSTCCKNPDLLIQKWKSVIHHVTNVHEWDGDSDCRACHHPPLPEEVVNNANWLVKDSVAHEQLKNIVDNPSLLKDLKQISFHCHTGELEIYHRTCLKYRPKSLHFFMDSMVARTQLAALDHNRNVLMVKAEVKNASCGETLGSMTQRLEDSKGQKSWIMKALYKQTSQNFLFDILNDVIALVKEEKTFQ